MKNLMKTLTTTLLIAALVLTGIVIPDANAVTVNAETATTVKNGGTITMKPGDVKNLAIKNPSGTSIAQDYTWKSSNTNIISTDTLILGPEEYLELTAKATGTVTVTGTNHYQSYNKGPATVKLTVKVTLPKATKKQKKCKHSYKTTKKATCTMVGIKTCKKCKYQTTIKKTSHNYKNTQTTEKASDYEVIDFLCQWDECGYMVTVSGADYGFGHDKTPTQEQKDACNEACSLAQHAVACGGTNTNDILIESGLKMTITGGGENGHTDHPVTPGWLFSPYTVTYDKPITVKMCKTCGKIKK